MADSLNGSSLDPTERSEGGSLQDQDVLMSEWCGL